MKNIKVPHIVLPSTSPANATFNLEKLVASYKIIVKLTK